MTDAQDMPIQIPPDLQPAAQARLARLAAQNTRFQAGAAQLQGRIDGTSGPPPGLLAEEAVNADLYGQYNTRIALFEAERRALDGVFPSPSVTDADIEAGAAHTGVFWSGNATLTPNNPPGLQGAGGADPDNENARKTSELSSISQLLQLSEFQRAGSAAYTEWVQSLEAQRDLLQTQIDSGTQNNSYGASHPDVMAALAEKAAIDALLPAPPVDTPSIQARQTQAQARQAFIPTRVNTLAVDAAPFRAQRFLLLKDRINPVSGTLARIRTSQKGIDTLNDIVIHNGAVIDLYDGLM